MILVAPFIVPDTRRVHEEIQCNGAVLNIISSNLQSSTPTTFEMIDACDTQTPVIKKRFVLVQNDWANNKFRLKVLNKNKTFAWSRSSRWAQNYRRIVDAIHFNGSEIHIDFLYCPKGWIHWIFKKKIQTNINSSSIPVGSYRLSIGSESPLVPLNVNTVALFPNFRNNSTTVSYTEMSQNITPGLMRSNMRRMSPFSTCVLRTFIVHPMHHDANTTGVNSASFSATKPNTCFFV